MDSTLVHIARAHAEAKPQETAFVFLASDLSESCRLSFGQVQETASRVASFLQRHGSIGDRALLLLSSDQEFVSVFFGCLYAGVIAVPTPPLQSRKEAQIQRVVAILRDARVEFIFVDEAIKDHFADLLAMAGVSERLQVLTLSMAVQETSRWDMPKIRSTDTAFLQYTSGSTGRPKGVVVSHSNILANEALIKKCFGHGAHTRFANWLPLFHDMGLIGNLLQPFYLGVTSVLMSPMTFLSKPANWLRAISAYGVTTTGGPNFGYELCATKVSDDELANLDLSSWEVAYVGAEPIRPKTIEGFAARFASCGFKREALYPCYGLAEATLLACGSLHGQGPAVTIFDKVAFSEGRVQQVDETFTEGSAKTSQYQLVSAGVVCNCEDLAIVDPVTNSRCNEGEIGEIWLRGPSVTQGYWRNSEETAQVFGANIRADLDSPHLRTGDIGFVNEGRLYIAGRIKDLIILNGRNVWPQDLEVTVQQCSSVLRSDAGAAFSIDDESGERLIVVQEIVRTARRSSSLNEVISNIHQSILEQHGVNAYDIVLILPMTLPKTSSGKVKRSRTRELYLRNELEPVARYRTEASEPAHHGTDSTWSTVETKIADIWKSVIDPAPIQICVDANFFHLGGDSLMAAQAIGRIRSVFGVEIQPEEFFSTPTVKRIASLVQDRMQLRRAISAAESPINSAGPVRRVREL